LALVIRRALPRECPDIAILSGGHLGEANLAKFVDLVDHGGGDGRSQLEGAEDSVATTGRKHMDDAKRLAVALNAVAKGPQFSNSKARAVARQEPSVNWPATKSRNEDFNPEVDGFESFVMKDASICAWVPGQFRYVARKEL
jgi:hypothetical protein